MPTYWYRCQACKHEFEEFQKISDPPVRECPECGGVVMRVITGGAGLIFKGTGFYITDYKRKESGHSDSESRNKSGPESKSSSSSSKSSTGSDKKSAAAGEE